MTIFTFQSDDDYARALHTLESVCGDWRIAGNNKVYVEDSCVTLIEGLLNSCSIKYSATRL